MSSPNWDDGSIVDVGAVTWCSKTAGCAGPVSAANSLVGSAAADHIGLTVFPVGGGNYAVASPDWDNGAVVDAGAATWCSGMTGCQGQVSGANSLVGVRQNERVGHWITDLSNGRYLVHSPDWYSERGALTPCSATVGCIGPVSLGNSLVGTWTGDRVGSGPVTILANGNHAVSSPSWNSYRGAVTFCDGSTGCTGQVSDANSLVGTTLDDHVGSLSPRKLTNGNYVVSTPFWDNGSLLNVGAVTWCSGTSGCVGEISPANSLIGGSPGDQVGSGGGNFGPYTLANGDYVVVSEKWTEARGAVTLCSGAGGCTGLVSAANSLVGAEMGDEIGYLVTDLSDGDCVVTSPLWSSHRGAATYCGRTTGCAGQVSATNSLVGTSPGDFVGFGGIRPLGNGDYVVGSYHWNSDRGAATWCSHTTGCRGEITEANSLVGTVPGDAVGAEVVALNNGHYVVGSSSWNGSRGAATWCNGTTGCTGEISPANSLVGSQPADYLGALALLTNGHYVVRSVGWGLLRGAVTWCSGAVGCTGTVSTANSLVGSLEGDVVGYVLPLVYGHYVVGTPQWNFGRGAMTWCNGTGGCVGTVSEANSLVGSTVDDQVGEWLEGNATPWFYVVRSPYWDNGGVVDAGALTPGSFFGGTIGAVSDSNSVIGEAPDGGMTMNYVFDLVNYQLVVARPAENTVTLFRLDRPDISAVYLPLVSKGSD